MTVAEPMPRIGCAEINLQWPDASDIERVPPLEANELPADTAIVEAAPRGHLGLRVDRNHGEQLLADGLRPSAAGQSDLEKAPAVTTYARLQGLFDNATALPTQENLTGFIQGFDVFPTEGRQNQRRNATLVGRIKTVDRDYGPEFPAEHYFQAIVYGGRVEENTRLQQYTARTQFTGTSVETDVGNAKTSFKRLASGAVVTKTVDGETAFYGYFYRAPVGQGQ